MPAEADPKQQPPGSLDRLEREEARLWRVSLLFLVFLATALAASSWERLTNLPHKLLLLPLAGLAVAVLFAIHISIKRAEVAALRGLLRGLQDRAAVPPSEAQLQQLTQVLVRSQRGFRDLIDSFEEAVFSVSLDGTLRTVNRHFAALLERPFTELVGNRLPDFLEEPALAQAEAAVAGFLPRPRWSGLVPVRLKGSARIRYFDCTLHGIEEDGAIAAIGVLARDVTQEREKETRFTELFETLQEGVYFSTPEGKLLDVNPALVRMLGFNSKEELLSAEVKTLYVDPNQRVTLSRQLEETGTVRDQQITLRRKDGAPIVCLDSSRAIWDGAGRLVRYQGTLVDITARLRMEKQLHSEAEFRRLLLQGFPDLVLVLDQLGRFSFVSPRIQDVLGFEPKALLGHKLEEAGERDRLRELAALHHDLASGKSRFGTAEFSFQHHDGSWRTLRASGSPLLNQEGKRSGVILSVRDITIERKMEQQLIQAERMAAMGQMIDGFAHELNNPLTSILGATELLQEMPLNENARKHLQTLLEQARRAAAIVQNLLYFSRPPAPGKVALDLNELIQRCLHLREYSLRVNNITVDFRPQPSLSAVTGDLNQLMQVLLNLIINAEQAMGDAHRPGTLRLRAGSNKDKVWISVQDDGPGIPSEILPKIFDPFFTTRRPGGGTGLGLSICRAVVREHGGTIEAAAAPGGGSVFTVSLPVHTSQTTAAQVSGGTGSNLSS